MRIFPVRVDFKGELPYDLASYLNRMHHPGKVVVFVDEIDSTIGLPFTKRAFPSGLKPTAKIQCFQVVLRDTDNSFHLETLNLDESNDPPIEGDPQALLKKWQERLGMTFDDEMRPVPKPPDGP